MKTIQYLILILLLYAYAYIHGAWVYASYHNIVSLLIGYSIVVITSIIFLIIFNWRPKCILN